MLHIIENDVVFKVFNQVPHHYMFQQLTADASKRYWLVLEGLYFSPFLKEERVVLRIQILILALYHQGLRPCEFCVILLIW